VVAGGDLKGLDLWQVAVQFATDIYGLTRDFPHCEICGLTAQLRRAAVSVPSNIAEGYGRGSLRQFLYFLKAARGSLAEIETQLVISQRMGYIAGPGALAERLRQLHRLLHGMIRSTERKLKP